MHIFFRYYLYYPYHNDPHERVYFIKSGPEKDAETKGYATATEVLLDSEEKGTSNEAAGSEDGAGASSTASEKNHRPKKGLYVNTISGNKINAGDTELILRGLEARKTELGIDHSLLPVKATIPDLISFPTIKGVYEHYSKGKTSVSIHHQYSDIRSAI